MKYLIIAEHDHQSLKLPTFSAVSAAQQLTNFHSQPHDIHLLILGNHCAAVADEASQLAFVKKILWIDSADYLYQLAENNSTVIADIAKNYDYVLAGASTFAKNLLPRVSALLDVDMLSDVTEIISADTFVRPMYAGNIFAEIKNSAAIKVMTLRTTAFKWKNIARQEPVAEKELLKTNVPNEKVIFKEQILTKSKRPELTSAKIVIAGGRGLKSKEAFQQLEVLADTLGAAVGASRAAVDAGFAPNDYQVGQTGKVVAPHLYIAIGISGAIQHLAGMKDSKMIVAINNDPEAPIFNIADFGLVADLFKVLPELTEQLAKLQINH